MTKAQEAKLLTQLQAGDQKAVARWFSALYPRLLAVAVTKVSVAADAEELVQETFLNCIRQIGFFRGSSSLWTWMNSVLRHEIADYYRKRYAKKALQTLPLFEKVVPAQVADATALAEQVVHVLSAMKHTYSELLLQKYVDKHPIKAIAHRAGRSVKAVESDLFRARKEFQELWALEEQKNALGIPHG